MMTLFGTLEAGESSLALLLLLGPAVGLGLIPVDTVNGELPSPSYWRFLPTRNEIFIHKY